MSAQHLKRPAHSAAPSHLVGLEASSLHAVSPEGQDAVLETNCREKIQLIKPSSLPERRLRLQPSSSAKEKRQNLSDIVWGARFALFKIKFLPPNNCPVFFVLEWKRELKNTQHGSERSTSGPRTGLDTRGAFGCHNPPGSSVNQVSTGWPGSPFKVIYLLGLRVTEGSPSPRQPSGGLRNFSLDIDTLTRATIHLYLWLRSGS